MDDKTAPTHQDHAAPSADAAQLTDAAVEAVAGGGSLKSLYSDVQRGLWANNPDILREVMVRNGAKPAVPAPLPGSAGKDV